MLPPRFGERRVVPHGVVDAEPHEPAKQQVVVDLLHQLPLGPYRVECLQQRGPQQPFRRDRLPPRAFVEPLEIAIECDQNVIDDGFDHAQRMLRRHPPLGSTYENSDPDLASDPRIPASLDGQPEPNHIRPTLSAGSSHLVSRREIQQPASLTVS